MSSLLRPSDRMRSPLRRVAAAFVTVVGIGTLLTFNGFLWTESDVEGSGVFHQAQTGQKMRDTDAQLDTQPGDDGYDINLAIASERDRFESPQTAIEDSVPSTDKPVVTDVNVATQSTTPGPTEKQHQDKPLVIDVNSVTQKATFKPTEKQRQEEEQKRQKDMKELDAELVYTLHELSQRATEPRGVVLPLFNDIAKLGMSLILELRALGVDLPFEIPICGGDVSEVARELFSSKKHLGRVRVYDACEMAAEVVSLTNPTRKVFCDNMVHCEQRFRSYDIKILSFFFSEFEEILLLDADTIFFQNPMALWETEKYQKTGTLFFTDRIAQPDIFLGAPANGRPGITRFQDYLSHAKVALYRDVPTLQRPNATLTNAIDVQLPFEPSDNLLSSHAWNRRAGHYMDSSCVLWNKTRQPRATVVLLSFIALNNVDRPPSHGDKELFLYACEIAETQYAFSEYAVGTIGNVIEDHGENASRVCGDMTQFLPETPATPGRAGTILYLNTKQILTFHPRTQAIVYTKPRPIELFVGPIPDHLYYCPIKVTILQLTDAHADQLMYRQQMHEVVVEWDRIATDATLTIEQRDAKSRELDSKLDDIFANVRELQSRIARH